MVALAILLPILFGLLLLLGLPRVLGVWGAALSFLLNLYLFLAHPGGVAYEVQAPLLPQAGVYWAFGLDGLSALFFLTIGLTVFLGALVARVEGRFLGLALLMSGLLLGLFAARDLLAFYLLFEAALIPALLMLYFYGGEGRVRAIYTFLLFTLAGSLPMLAAVLALRVLGGSPTFLLEDLLAHPVEGTAAFWVFLGFALAFAVKTPLFPVHAWLPLFHRENHPSGLADALGTLYKVGVFAFFRFAIPLAPEGFYALQGLLLLLAAAGALYGAWLAFAARDFKTLLAYAGVSHMGIAALGVFSGTPEGALGGLYLLAASGIYTGGLFLLAGRVHERVGTLEIGRYRGLAASAPGLAALALFLLLAMIGLPGLSGFPGELLVLLGAYKASPWLAALAFLSVIAGAAYALTAFQRVFWEKGEWRMEDLKGAEWPFALLAVAALFLMGVFPGFFLKGLEPLAEAFARILGGGA
ncbi:complex I subunit 4 family protein [Thermus thermamylovorans]|uniref:NADH-quinone oxidoreductase subunit M n=1 Tax=Thermus thermamylovorans TaxID=2509362 RepID=A0A4Q9B605_9DEIN|nr:NADH-quinone oxidoreductase subunit M [Thermus thermamylovorans]TBH21372.1 NADH-quinone oxidoreductase subunit M [Thermus thermamylovorans]